MKRSIPFRYLTLALTVASSVLVSAPLLAEDWRRGMVEGPVHLKSAGPLAFGPEGILLVADSKAAAVVAIDTGDRKAPSGERLLKVEGVNLKIASMLGTAADQILIQDLAINPASRNAYLAVSRGRGPDAVPVLVRVTASGQPELVALDKVAHARAELPDAPIDGVVGQGNRQSNPRQESITDLAFFQDRVLIAGLSNEEFASTLRAIPFPFKNVANGTSVEIYHGAHGRFETRSPVRTFVPFKIGREPHLLAAYTCTPLVQFPIRDLEPGAKIKGKTIAELGNRNRPIDMIVYEKGGKEYVLLANSSRGVMKIDPATIADTDAITSPVPDGGKKGLPYETIEALTGVDQLDQLDATHAVVLRRSAGTAINLESVALP